MKRSGAVTAFAADSSVSRLGPRRAQHGASVGRVAEKTSMDSVDHVEWFTEDVLTSLCVG